jgi:lipopolysaccharide transport system permease protein
MVLGSALLHFLVSLTVLLTFCLLAGTPLQAGTLLIPVLMFPLFLITIGLTWGFASLGVYLPDLAQGMGMLTTIALVLAPVFYPIDALPKVYQMALCFNPITLPILQIRDVMFWGKPIDWLGWAISLAIGCIICCLGFWWFQKMRKGFADVL